MNVRSNDVVRNNARIIILLSPRVQPAGGEARGQVKKQKNVRSNI